MENGSNELPKNLGSLLELKHNSEQKVDGCNIIKNKL